MGLTLDQERHEGDCKTWWRTRVAITAATSGHLQVLEVGALGEVLR